MVSPRLIEMLRSVAMLVFAPTRLVINYLKRQGGEHGAKVLLRWNHYFFCGELVLAFLLALSSIIVPAFAVPNWVAYFFLALAFWRCNEITIAFVRDANRELDQSEPKTTLTRGQRIKMAMRSYVGLHLNFAVIYYFVPRSLFDPKFTNFVEALYFSGVTLATLGYGDIKPAHYVSQLLSLYEVFAGLLLVVVAFAVYLSALGQERG